MIVETTHVSERAAELKRSFDRTFAETQHFDPIATDDFLAIRAGGEPHALRLAEIKGFFADKKVTAMPSPAPALSGIAGFRGSILPVYDLAALLGYPQSKSARWMAIAADAPIAIVFDEFDGHFRCPREAMAQADSKTSQHIRGLTRSAGRTYPVVHLPSVVAAVTERRPTAAPKKEQ